MFDITTIAVAATTTFQLRDAAGNLLFTAAADNEAAQPVNVTVYGPGSAQYADATAKRNRRQLERLRKKGRVEITADETTKEVSEFLAAITVSFDNLSYPPAGGATGYELFKAVYADRRLGFIADQVQEKIGDWENFTNGSATS